MNFKWIKEIAINLMAIAMVYNVQITTTMGFSLQKSKQKKIKMERWCWFVITTWIAKMEINALYNAHNTMIDL